MKNQHKADELVDRIVELLTGLETTGTNIVAERAYPVPDDGAELRALSVWMGDDEMIDNNTARETWQLDTHVVIHVSENQADAGATNDANTRRTILRIAREIHIAINANFQLSLPFVLRAMVINRGRPEIAEAAAWPTAQCEIVIRAMYRFNYSDPAAFTPTG